MADRNLLTRLALMLVCVGLGVAVVLQLRVRLGVQPTAMGDDLEIVVSDLLDSNARLSQEIQALQAQITQLQEEQGGGVLLEALVNEVNQLRIANGLVEVSGAGIEVVVNGSITVLDLQDLINEVRNAGAEALALNAHRVVAWSALSTDGQEIRVDGQPVGEPIYLQAIGDPGAMEVAVARPGGVVSLLRQARADVSIQVQQRQKLTLPVYDQPVALLYATPVE